MPQIFPSRLYQSSWHIIGVLWQIHPHHCLLPVRHHAMYWMNGQWVPSLLEGTDEYALILHTLICIFTYFDTYALWRYSAPFGYLQCLYNLKLQNVLHMSTPYLNILSCVHTSCISTSPNIQQSSTHALCVARTFAHLQTHIPSYPIISQVYYTTSLNIFLH